MSPQPHRTSMKSAHRTAWEPARPVGTRWRRITDSVRLVTSVAGLVTGSRVTRTFPR